MSRNIEKIQIVVQRASGVSRAWWPAKTRKSVATGKLAQLRRYLQRQETLWVMFTRVWNSRIVLMVTLAITSMVMGGVIVAALLLANWYFLLVPFILSGSVVSIVTIVVFLSIRIHPVLAREKGQATFERHVSPANTFPPLQALKSFPGFSLGQRDPETPMPIAPLVRVLETVDLSQTDVVHFLDPDTAELPVIIKEEQKASITQEKNHQTHPTQ